MALQSLFKKCSSHYLIVAFFDGPVLAHFCPFFYFFAAMWVKSEIENQLASRYKKIFPNIDSSEIIPRLSATGITYHAEFNGRLLYIEAVPVNVPKYNEEQKMRTLKFATTVLDLIINKRISITIEN